VLTIKPADNQTIWIQLSDGVSIENGKKIYIDDSAKNCKVCFYIPENGNVSFSGNNTIETLNYKEYFTKATDQGGLNGVLYQDMSKSGASNYTSYIPKVYLYSGKNASLSIDNDSIFTGYIYAPYLTLSLKKGLNIGVTSYVDANNVSTSITGENQQVGVIGAAVVGNIKTDGVASIFFVSEDSSGTTSDGSITDTADGNSIKWISSNYQNG
jgi:hypothetical protein